MHVKYGLIVAVICVVIFSGLYECNGSETPPEPSGAVVKLFDGQTLDGWKADVPKADKNPDIAPSFVVRDGKLVSMGNPRGHLITNDDYRDYRLDVEYRFTGKPGNCGVLIHSSTPRALSGMFPQSIEVQMQSGHAGDFWVIKEDIEVPDMVARRGPKEKWGKGRGKKRRILNLTEKSEKPLGEWNHMIIVCNKREVKVWVNGDLVNHGFNCTTDHGKIALQAEGTEVEFRRVDLAPLAK